MRYCIAALVLLAAAGHAASAAAYIQVAGRDVAIWKPAAPSPPSGYPLILFSHGFSGCATQSIFLVEALARAGYLVLAPNHRDAACKADGQGSLGKLLSIRPEQPFRDDRQWSDQTYKDRAADLEAILDAAAHGPVSPGAIADMTRVGIAGHSLGGYTALGLGGAWPSWKDPRIKAVLALSPYCTPYVARGALGAMNVPVMYQGGTADLGITPTVKRLSGAYEHTSAPKYYVEFQGAGHFAWTNLNTRLPGTHQSLQPRFLRGLRQRAKVRDRHHHCPADAGARKRSPRRRAVTGVPLPALHSCARWHADVF